MKKIYFTLFLIILFSSCEPGTDYNEVLKFYGDAKEDIGYSIAIAADGYYISGQLTQVTRNGNQITGSSKKVGIIKTGLDGCLTGEPKYFDEKLQGSGSKIIVLEDGSAVCAGQVTDSTQQSDIFVVRIGADGEILSKNTFRSPGNQTSSDILKTTEGFMLLGTTNVERLPVTDSTGNRAGRKDILLMRLDENLQQIGTVASKGFPGDDYGVAIKNDIGGGFIIAGTTDRTESGKAKSNLYLMKVNVVGSETGAAIIGSNSDEYASDIEVLEDGYLLSGTVNGDNGDRSVYIAKIPAEINSTPEFSREINPDNESWSVNAMGRYKNNFFVFAGKAGSRMLIFVTDFEGNVVPGWIKLSGGTGDQACYDVATDDEDNIIAVGKCSYESNSLISLYKFRF